MKARFLLVALFILLLPAAAFGKGDKALMLTVFGTSTEATITFDELVPLVEARFPDREVFVPYTSGVIRNKLNAEIKDPAEKILSPEEMLNRLKSEGYKDIAVVSTILFAGVEHDKLKATVESFASANQGLKVSYTAPLLSQEANLQPVVNLLGKYMLAEGSNIVVAHGTHKGHPVEKTYLRISELVSNTYPNARVGSIEGVPDMDDALDWAEDRAGDIRFVIFMFVAGDHAENDVAGEDEESLFSAAKEMGKIPSVAWMEAGGKRRMASLGLDPEYRAMLLDYYARNVK